MIINLWQLAFLIILLLLASSILNKAGFSRWWSLCLFLPVVNILMIWAFAFIAWPTEKAAADQLEQKQ